MPQQVLDILPLARFAIKDACGAMAEGVNVHGLAQGAPGVGGDNVAEAIGGEGKQPRVRGHVAQVVKIPAEHAPRAGREGPLLRLPALGRVLQSCPSASPLQDIAPANAQELRPTEAGCQRQPQQRPIAAAAQRVRDNRQDALRLLQRQHLGPGIRPHLGALDALGGVVLGEALLLGIAEK